MCVTVFQEDLLSCLSLVTDAAVCSGVTPNLPECMSIVQLAQHQRAELVALAPCGDVLCLSAVSLLVSVTVVCSVVKPRDGRETIQELQYRSMN